MHRIVFPGPKEGTFLSEAGESLIPPEGWAFLPAGDAAVTRSVKTMGPTWVVQIRRGRRVISKGVWADKESISASRSEVKAKRATPQYERRRELDLARRESRQNSYVIDFSREVMGFLNFHKRYEIEALRISELVTAHATPVGSGTVARTRRIPIEKRAESAVIAWMRHKTTAYDSMQIARIKGKRRETRRELAARSVEVLNAYRLGIERPQVCPLKKALLLALPE